MNLVPFVFLFGLHLVYCHVPNTCKTFQDYQNVIHNSKCWYNPDLKLTTEGFAIKYGYPIESYTVETADGYFLNIYRLPQRHYKRGTVILQHPSLASSSVWVDKGNYSLGFQLYDQGYEIWLLNTRGNEFARKHKTLSPNHVRFWDYCLDDLIKYDVPAQLSLIEKVSEDARNMVFMGHSLGGSLAILIPLLYPQHAQKLFKTFIAVSPGTTFKHTRIPLSPHIATHSALLEKTARQLNLLELNNPILRKLMQQTCANNKAVEFCAHMLYFLMGPSFMEQVKPEWIPLFFAQQSSSISARVLLQHFLNRRDGGKFQAYNYGSVENLRRYHSVEPPQYYVEHIKQPIYFISGGRDNLCTAEDTEEIYQRLPEEAKSFGHKIFADFNHMDFLYGRHTQDFNNNIILFLNKLYPHRI